MTHNTSVYPALVMDQVMAELEKNQTNETATINFCQAGSSFNPFDHVHSFISSHHLRSLIPYERLAGRRSLCEAIALHYGQEFNQDISPDRICMTAGATEALTIAFAMLTQPQSEVILAAAHFPPFRCLAHLFNVDCKFAPLDERNRIDVEQLTKLITPKTAVIIINSPSNPHGAVLEASELAAIAELGIPIIFDEVYQPLGLRDEPIPSAIPHADQHFIVNSYSKSLSLAGFRIGYLIVPESKISLMLDVKATLSFSTSSFSQAIVAELLPHWTQLITAHKLLLQSRWHHFASCAATLGLDILPPPQGGLYGLVDIGPQRNPAQVTLDLARKVSLGVAPGSDFQTADSHYLRLNYAGAASQLEPGLTRLAAYLS